MIKYKFFLLLTNSYLDSTNKSYEYINNRNSNFKIYNDYNDNDKISSSSTILPKKYKKIKKAPVYKDLTIEKEIPIEDLTIENNI
jgi:hypothetical protein